MTQAQQKRHEYPERVFAVKVIGKRWYYAETYLHYIEGNKSAYFATTNDRGAAHGAISKRFPELRPLIALHLADEDGMPMHPLENAWYHYAEGVDEQGRREFYESEDAKKAEQERREERAYQNFMTAYTGTETTLLCDIWNSVSGYTWKAQHYMNTMFQHAQKCKQSVKSTLSALVVKRNNEHLARHLRITLDEARAIPANLTKEQFNNKYILPNIPRWNREAVDAIRFMQTHCDSLPDTVEQLRTYYFSHETFKRWKDGASDWHGIRFAG